MMQVRLSGQRYGLSHRLAVTALGNRAPRACLVPSSILVFMALCSGAIAALNPPVQQDVKLAFVAPAVSSGLRR